MLDFMMVSTKAVKSGLVEIYPKFRINNKSKDLMIRGGDFYAIWLEEEGRWSTEEQDCLDLIDKILDQYVEDHKQSFDSYRVLHMWDAETGMIDRWHKFVQKQCRDAFHMLDEKIIFANDPVKKTDYSSKRLPYPLESGDISSWNQIIDTLYSEEEKRKIEWAIGAIVTGDSKKIQKFMVFYGAAGTGKSTVMNIIQELFDGYYSVFDARALGSSSNSFALEAFKNNPLVAIQHDGDLSRIEDNTRINSLVAHEKMTVNEKHKGLYENKFKAFLFMGTNKPVRITDAKSGLIRRLIDVTPTGNKLSRTEYNRCMKQVIFELGAIASHCKEIYLEDPFYYDSYIPTNMLGSTNDFYNFIEDSFDIFTRDDQTTLKAAFEMYKTYCENAAVAYPMNRRAFKEELKNYFKEFTDRKNGIVNLYSGFDLQKYDNPIPEKSRGKKSEKTFEKSWIDLRKQRSLLDDMLADTPAQYTNENETPLYSWSKVKTKLKDIDTSKVHYVNIKDDHHIVIDFDIKNEKGEKDAKLNIDAVLSSGLPETYAEVSKGGAGIHLHYIYSGDVSRLSRVFADNIEIKVFTGDQALRRKLTKCNDIPVAKLKHGLPTRKEKKKEVLNLDAAQSEKGLRSTVIKCLRKEVHPDTASNINFIKKILDDAFESGMKYDLSDLESDVIAFAAGSTHQAEKCLKLTGEMHFSSEELTSSVTFDEREIAFYDCEVFPNLFLVNYKKASSDTVNRLINPKPTDIEQLLKFRLIGFNCRDYDNHMIYACYMGYNNEQIYELSQTIINGIDKNEKRAAKFGNAYNLSYTDIYDFSSKKQSLKKWEIELCNLANDPDSKLSDEDRKRISKIKHHELGLPWDQPVPKSIWDKVAEYCDDDVLATEALFYYLKGDWLAREILADLAGMSVNDTTNSLTTRIIFGKEKKPALVYTNLDTGVQEPEDKHHKANNSFPGYEFRYLTEDDGLPIDNKKHNMFRGVDLGMGGYVYAQPGVYGNVALLDVQSLHPNSTVQLNAFGPYTQKYKDILQARVLIKHKQFEEAKELFDGKLSPYLDDPSTAKNLSQALKIAINSVYGLTSATFDNPFKDRRNVNNIVALRGALFMKTLQDEVTAKGYTVVHIKTDSIKIADADMKIINFCMDFAKKYGYIFEHEATYDKMCLVNNAVYIAKYATPEKCEDIYNKGYIPSECQEHGGQWTATGTQFQVPYVFKTLFTHEPIIFQDMCVINQVKTAIYLDKNESMPDVSEQEKELKKLETEFKKGLIIEDSYLKEKELLDKEISYGHNYIFVGKVGQFTPILPGCDGALLVADRSGKYAAVTGTKGYRWLESDMVKELGKENDIDRSYFTALVDDAFAAIAEQCGDKYDPEWFCSDDEYVSLPWN